MRPGDESLGSTVACPVARPGVQELDGRMEFLHVNGQARIIEPDRRSPRFAREFSIESRRREDLPWILTVVDR
jgi:hypothetical protein